MQKLNRTSVLVFLIIAALGATVIFKYRFLWPVLLFVILGFTRAKDHKK